MKTLYITALLVVATTCAFSQTKHLPTKVTITLTPQEVLRIDSAVQSASASVDSKRWTQWFVGSFAPLYEQVNKQLVADSIKVVKPVKK